MQINYEKLTGEWVKAMRQGRWTQEELAVRMADLGEPIHATAITRLERGDRSVRLNEWIALLAALETSVEQYFDFARTFTEFGAGLEVELKRMEDEPPTPLETAQAVEQIVGIAHKMISEVVQRETRERQ